MVHVISSQERYNLQFLLACRVICFLPFQFRYHCAVLRATLVGHHSRPTVHGGWCRFAVLVLSVCVVCSSIWK